MPFHVRDPKTDALVRELARNRGIGITEVIKQAVGAELARESAKPDRLERLRALRAEIAALPRSGSKTDKAFFDDLSGDPD